ncbi:GntR family transcriptional regulator [Cochlodiniinecator piscidefendens]|uniref:GntR family transcriptional regulator n=1 Tax=Cochlodiniinecator piscidefendens TaxID=2715756 RepID=UPI0014073393|nr:GntR family transcriptional regulator [Cochlodiniinecator piscidefendens]
MNVTEFLRPEHWLSATAGPRYVQLRRRIEEGIASGLLPIESPLPPEREVAAITTLSRVTVRKAIQELVDKGSVVQKQGSGSFIQDSTLRVEQSLSQLTSFTEDMSNRGMESHSVWLERGVFLTSSEEAKALNLEPEHSVARIARLRHAQDRPIAIERASLPLDLLPNPLAVTSSLYEVLGQDGNRPERATQKISAVNLSEADAELLDVTPNAAGLKIERTSFLSSGRVVEFTRSLYRGDAYDFVAEMRLAHP